MKYKFYQKILSKNQNRKLLLPSLCTYLVITENNRLLFSQRTIPKASFLLQIKIIKDSKPNFFQACIKQLTTFQK